MKMETKISWGGRERKNMYLITVFFSFTRLSFCHRFFFFIMKIYIFKDYLLPGSIWELTALYVFCKHLKTLDYLWCKGWCWFLLFVHLVACWSQSFFLSFFVFFNRKLSLSPVFTGTHDAMWLYNGQWVMWLTSWPWQ